MLINKVYIGYYLLVAILGLFVGQMVDYASKRLSKEKRVFTKDIFKEYSRIFRPNYILMFVTMILYVGIVYTFGLGNSLVETITCVKYLILVPMLLCVVIIDYKYQIIPNRLNLTMLEIGLVFSFIYGMSDIAVTIDCFLGALVGGGIFLGITLLGGLVYGKEAMGLGDVKLMGVLGLYFGLTNIIAISLMSFLIGAILSIFLLVTRIKKIDEYIPFGPFIVIAALISVFVPFEIILNVLLNIFTLGLYSKNMR
jgi:leader peptidase (prepilin peptidase)/N-methyltransferase